LAFVRDAGCRLADRSGGRIAVSTLIGLTISVLSFVSAWKVCVKTRQPGWIFLVPILNLYMLLKVTGKPGWWMILYVIPGVNVIAHALVNIALARTFKLGRLFGLGLAFLPMVFLPILAFGDATYGGIPVRSMYDD
jgi:hypothetical protein